MATKSSTSEVKQVALTILEKEEKAVIVSVKGWRMRVYFGNDMKETDKDKLTKGGNVIADYTGDIEDPHNVHFLPLKSE